MATQTDTNADERADDQQPHDDAPPRRRREAVLVIASVALGVGAAYALLGGGAGAERLDIGSGDGPAIVIDTSVEAAGAVDLGQVDTVSRPADSPEAAAASFLTAEVERDLATSHVLLAADDADRYDSVARWVAAHSQFPTLAGYQLGEPRTDTRGDTFVDASVRLDSTLDSILGLVPARAELELALVEVDGGWLVDWTGSTFTALLPDDADAVTAARDWAADAAVCETPRQYDGGLFGTRSLVTDLCGVTTELVIGAVTTLPADGGDRGLVSAFGGEVAGWARVVPLRGDVDIDIVLAPVDDAWLVIGVLAPRSP